jgi:hypothetical protein
MGGDRWLKLVPCPACGVPAEVTDRFSLAGTGGPVDHLELRCVTGHHFRMPVDLLSAQGQRQLLAEEAELETVVVDRNS